MMQVAESNKAFSPLTDREKNSSDLLLGTRKKSNDLQVAMPVPDEAPKPDFIHQKHGRAEKGSRWPYRGVDGALLFYVCRFECDDGKQVLPYTCWYDPEGDCYKWSWKGIGQSIPLYGLQKLIERPHAPVLMVEGEKACDAAQELLPDYCVLTSCGGCNQVGKADFSTVQDRHIAIWPDADAPGKQYARAAAMRMLEAGALSVSIVPLPKNKPKGWDAHDALNADGWGSGDARALMDQAELFTGEAQMPVGYFVSNNVLYYQKPEDESDNAAIVEVCDPFIEVIAMTRDESGMNFGRRVRWKDSDNREHIENIPMTWLSGDSTLMREFFLNGGVVIPTNRRARGLFSEYFSKSKPLCKLECVSQIGWHNGVFVLPDVNIPKANHLILQRHDTQKLPFQVSGTLEQWKEHIGQYVSGNSRLVLAVCTAFAVPLIRVLNEESGGFHLRGSSSVGKSTALEVAASVWGGGETPYIQTWRSTSNGLEAIAETRNDALLCLDELGQANARDVGEAIYMIANRQGKIRANARGGMRQQSVWRSLFLSTGEISLDAKLQEDRKVAQAGQAVRLVDIPADAEKGLGLFEDLHGFANGDAFSRYLKDRSRQYFGAPIRAFLERITPIYRENLEGDIRLAKNAFLTQITGDVDGQVRRVAGRFGLLYAAGKLALNNDILPIEEKNLLRDLSLCFTAWIENRGTAGSLELQQGVERVKDFLERHGNSRFARNDYVHDEQNRRIINQAGYLHSPDNGAPREFWIFPSVFRGEILNGMDHMPITRELVRLGLMKTDSEGKQSVTKRVKVPGEHTPKSRRFVVISSGILELEPG